MSVIFYYPLATEKAVSGIEAINEIVVIVSRKASKKQVREEAQALFKASVKSVRTSVVGGRKKAVIKFVKPGEAADVAARLKII